MELVSKSMERPEISPEQSASNALITRIRKLRWMGMEEEAEQLENLLRRTPSADVLLSSPCDTD